MCNRCSVRICGIATEVLKKLVYAIARQKNGAEDMCNNIFVPPPPPLSESENPPPLVPHIFGAIGNIIFFSRKRKRKGRISDDVIS